MKNDKKIDGQLVDVSTERCGPDLECFAIGFDKGSFVKGKRYSCLTKHLYGCPHVEVCLDCRSCICITDANLNKCQSCGFTNLQKDKQ